MGKTALGLLSLMLLAALLAGCGGGMGSAEVEKSLVAFFGEIDQTYKDAGEPPLKKKDDLMQWKIDLESKQLEIVDRYLAENEYPEDINQLMQQMRVGLASHINGLEIWLETGTNRDKAPPEEVAAIDRTVQKSTEAETKLRVEAGL